MSRSISQMTSVSVYRYDEAMIDKAITIITGIMTDIEAGMVFEGKVVRIMNLAHLLSWLPTRTDGPHFKLSDKRRARLRMWSILATRLRSR